MLLMNCINFCSRIVFIGQSYLWEPKRNSIKKKVNLTDLPSGWWPVNYECSPDWMDLNWKVNIVELVFVNWIHFNAGNFIPFWIADFYRIHHSQFQSIALWQNNSTDELILIMINNLCNCLIACERSQEV